MGAGLDSLPPFEKVSQGEQGDEGEEVVLEGPVVPSFRQWQWIPIGHTGVVQPYSAMDIGSCLETN